MVWLFHIVSSDFSTSISIDYVVSTHYFRPNFCRLRSFARSPNEFQNSRKKSVGLLTNIISIEFADWIHSMMMILLLLACVRVFFVLFCSFASDEMIRWWDLLLFFLLQDDRIFCDRFVRSFARAEYSEKNSETNVAFNKPRLNATDSFFIRHACAKF